MAATKTWAAPWKMRISRECLRASRAAKTLAEREASRGRHWERGRGVLQQGTKQRRPAQPKEQWVAGQVKITKWVGWSVNITKEGPINKGSRETDLPRIEPALDALARLAGVQPALPKDRSPGCARKVGRRASCLRSSGHRSTAWSGQQADGAQQGQRGSHGWSGVCQRPLAALATRASNCARDVCSSSITAALFKTGHSFSRSTCTQGRPHPGKLADTRHDGPMADLPFNAFHHWRRFPRSHPSPCNWKNEAGCMVMADFGQTDFGQTNFGQPFDRLWPIVGLTDFGQF